MGTAPEFITLLSRAAGVRILHSTVHFLHTCKRPSHESTGGAAANTKEFARLIVLRQIASVSGDRVAQGKMREECSLPACQTNRNESSNRFVVESIMKTVIISDIHGNYDALSHLPEDYDELWVLGDLVNYGPQPGEVISFVRNRGTHVVRGNHDHSIGFGEALVSSPRFREMAETTRRYTDAVLNGEDKEYLRSLPLEFDVWIGGMRCRLSHALVSDPPFTKHVSNVAQWEDECRRVGADVLFAAHGHAAFGRQVGKMLLVNPGSLGQPRSGESVASYAVLKDGKLSLRSYRYPVSLTAKKIRAMPISALVRSELITILRTGSVPQERRQPAGLDTHPYFLPVEPGNFGADVKLFAGF
jgi:putative phosphoesterase